MSTATTRIDQWLTEATKIREQDGGYTFESLAVAMVLKLGWPAAAKIADHLESYVRGWYVEEGPRAEAAPLYELLGWEQSALLHAWFANLDNYRMVRDEFPDGGGIKKTDGAAA
ncbi:hypothetical protein [Streptomyces sp. NPDC003710]